MTEETMTNENARHNHDPKDAVEHLRRAEHDLEQAHEKGREAAREEAEAEIKEAIDDLAEAKQYTVVVIYNGVKKKFEVRPEETVKHLLDEAIKAFGSIPNPHTLSLYNKQGAELLDTQTLKQAGVRPHDELLLRPSTVKGGT
jgi:vacuolar-type H+-ATPase subunit F/Vma7